jgi:hypothetical protein
MHDALHPPASIVGWIRLGMLQAGAAQTIAIDVDAAAPDLDAELSNLLQVDAHWLNVTLEHQWLEAVQRELSGRQLHVNTALPCTETTAATSRPPAAR